MDLTQGQPVLPGILQDLPAPVLHQILAHVFTAPQSYGLPAVAPRAGAPQGLPQPPASCGDYEDLIVQVLRESEGKAWTYRRSLESLDMVRQPAESDRSIRIVFRIHSYIINTTATQHSFCPVEGFLPRPCPTVQ